MTVVASAPGKIVLSGEYAVLFGAPGDLHGRSIVARGRHECPTAVTVDAMSPRRVFSGRCAVCRWSMLVQGSTSPARRYGSRYAGIRFSIVLDSQKLSRMAIGEKMGIGSSAALTVALAAAKQPFPRCVCRCARAAHRRLQAGAGSGVDVAAAVHGGLIEYEMSSQGVKPLRWPHGLCLRVLWTGVAASTGAKLQKLAAQSVRPSRSALGLAASTMAEAWRSGDATTDPRSSTWPTSGVLRQFSVDHGLGIFDAGHDELTDAAIVQQPGLQAVRCRGRRHRHSVRQRRRGTRCVRGADGPMTSCAAWCPVTWIRMACGWNRHDGLAYLRTSTG